MSSIPKTLIIGVFLHGELHLTDDGDIDNDIVPDRMRVTVINSVAPGVPNISTLEEYEHMATQISKTVKEGKNYDKLTNSQINRIAENLRDMLVKKNKDQSNNIIKEHQHLYSKNNVTSVLQKFVHQYGNSFKIKTYEANDKIPNKLFIKFNEGEVINPDNIEEKYFNNIVLYNLEELDLFKMLKSAHLDIDQITLGEMLEFLANLGVQNLIIVDKSCSTIKGNPEFLTERNIRLIRRQMLFN
jgi:hypothetical protein